jgi:hypothetical protein
MRMILLVAAALFLASGAVLAQTAPSPTRDAPAPPSAAGNVQRPVDNGPATPGANSAYQGGGVVLQGAPGAPAPKPQATPPGGMPQNAAPK